MNNRIEPSPTFKREAKRLNKRYASFAADYEKLLENLSANPHLGTDLGGGLRKIRMAITSKGKGKVIVQVDETEINLLTIYDKAERESISKEELKELLQKNGLA